jgi:putative pyruvate formate lyase activating enzyme
MTGFPSIASLASPCRLCPRACEVDRAGGETGFCGVGSVPVVSSAGPHYGEEPPLVGRGGSGTIFLAGCNLGCVFCQNDDISHGLAGREVTPAGVAEIALGLERLGCENVNFVTPTHFAHGLAEAVALARDRGLTVPVVYNCSGYESMDVLPRLEGLVEIYMPDAKFWNPASSERYCRAPDYPEVMQAALREMHRQVGDLEVVGGVATRGLLVRHLVMPGGTAESLAILDFLAREISANTYVNVMDQYRPCYRAHAYPEIARYPSHEEYAAAYRHASELGLRLAR